MALLNTLMAFNLLDGGAGLYATVAVLVVALIAIVLLAFVKKEVIYIDPDTDYEIAHKKYGWGKKITLASANKTGKKFIGWAYDENGMKKVGKLKIRLFKTTELYAVWANPGVASVEDSNFAMDFVYVNDVTGADVAKESFAFLINIPETVNGDKVIGWGLDEESGPVIPVGESEEKSVLTLELYPYREGWEEKVDAEPVEAVEEPAPVEEPVAEEAPAEEPVVEVVEEVAEEAPVEEAPAEVVEEVAEIEEAPAEEPVVEEVETVAPVVDKTGLVLDIRYSRSVTANIIQADDEVKNFYSELKNHILSYKGVKSRFSWKLESFNKGRTQLFKIKLRGKTICLYCALDPNEFDKAKYHHSEIDAKSLAAVPMLVKIKSKLALKKAKELVDILMAKLEIVTNPKAVAVDYVAAYPYEENEPLIERGLIKVREVEVSADAVAVEDDDADDVAEVTEETPAEVVEEVVEPVAEEEPAEELAPAEPVIVPTYVDGNGNTLNIKYSRSVTANIIQAEDETKSFYGELKNHILSYKGVKSRFSWKLESFNKGRTQLFKIKLRGKTICLYCALDPNEFEKSKYHHEAIDAKIFADVPMLIKIKSKLALKKAKELVDILMAKLEIVTNPKAVAVDYAAEYPYEETDALVQKGLIKILQANADDVKVAAPIVDEEPEVVEEAPVEEAPAEVVEEIVEPVAEEESEPFVEVIEEPIEEEPVEEVAEEEAPVEEPAEEVVEEEAPVEEPAEDVVEEEAPAEEPAEEEVVEEVADEEPAEEEVVEEVADEEPAEEEVVEEAPVEEPAEEEVVEEAPVEEPAEEEVVEEAPVEEPAPATTVEEMHIVESVSAEEVDDLVVDEVVDSLVEEDVEYVTEADTKKAIVNIDTLSASFEAGEVVDLASLKAKGLIHKKSKSVKVLARGAIDKPLTVRANEFSETALKMIILTGGSAVKVTSKVK